MISSIVDIMTPFLLAALGGLVTELAGSLVIALEGFILVGAFVALAVAGATGSALAGIAASAVFVTAAAWAFGRFTIGTKANIFITGLAVNLFAAGLTAWASAVLFGTKGVVKPAGLEPLARLSIPAIERLPVIGGLLSGHTVFAYLSWILALALAVFLKRTRTGLRIRASGMDAQAATVRGVDPDRYRLIAISLSGFFCALAGAGLSLGAGAYIPNISSGRGWIALVAIYLGGRTTGGVVAASAVFAVAEYLSNIAQGTVAIPGSLLLAFPYLVTFAVFVGYAIYKKGRGKLD